MPDRPTDPPEYDWLYGEERPATAQPSEHTRVQPRVQPTAQPQQQRSATSTRRRVPWVKLVLSLVALWLVYLVAVPFWAWGQVNSFDPWPNNRLADQPGTTYLLVGSDSRKGLSKAENRKLGTGGVGDVGQRTDSIMLLHTGSGPSMLLSIPRDSLVDIPGRGTTKINAAYAYGGARLLIRTIEKNTGVHIDHFVEVGFGGFVNAVDAVGGVTVCPTSDMRDPRANLNIKKGCQEVDGVTALGYSRSRHSDPALGDITRARHQREVVGAIGAKVKSPWSILNPVRYYRLNVAATDSLRVSEGTGPVAMMRFALAMTRVTGPSGLNCSMPIRDLAVHWDEPRARALMRLVKADRTADIPKRLCQPTGLDK